MRRRHLLASLGVATAVGLVGCQGQSGTDSGSGPQRSESDDTEGSEGNSGPEGVDREIQFAVGAAGERHLSPAVQAVERSEEVRIQFANEGPTSTSVSVEAYPITAELAPGDRTAVTFSFHAPGIFPITTGQLRHTGQFFVYPTADSELPQVTDRELRLLVDRVAGRTSLYPPTLFALEYDDITLEVVNATTEETSVSVDALGVSKPVGPDSSAELSFVTESPGIYRVTTDATVDGQLVVLPEKSDFSRIPVADRRYRHLVADDEAEWLHCLPSTLVCKANEELVLDVLDAEGSGTGDAETVRATPQNSGVHSLSSLSDTRELKGQVVALP